MRRKIIGGIAVATLVWAVSDGTRPTSAAAKALASLDAAAKQLSRAQEQAEWPAYAGNKLAQKYSPLDQINKDNVKNLRIVWRQSATPTGVRQGRPDIPVPSDYQHTPLMVGGLLYMNTGLLSVAALDPTTGKVVWSDPPAQIEGRGAGAGRPNRGLAYWTDGKDARIVALNGQYLIALNAKTGKRYLDFGERGQVDLARGYDVRSGTPVGGFGWSSHAIVVRDVIVVGGGARLASAGNAPGLARKEAPPGDIRGYDARTGNRLWTFHVVPRPGEFGDDTWLNDSLYYSGSAGTWSWMSADEELGYVYVATEEATSDFFGGARPGNNLFSNSVVCLDARTGRRIWHFQAIHHGMWDWDLPTAPILADINVDGRKIKAAVQLSKQAFAYVLDRETGKPVWPIEERPVPKGDTPGEWYSPTQPFPTKPPAYEMQGITIDDLIDFTPELRQEAIKVISKYRYGPIYTPASPRQAIIMNPGTVGGSNWNGGGLDPQTGMLYVPTVRLPTIIEIVPPQNPASTLPLVRRSTALDTNLELPIGGGLPILKPPYGSVVAIDLNKGDIAWRVPNGNGPRDHPTLKPLNLRPLGTIGRPSPLVTKTLLFLGEGMGRGVARIPVYGGGKIFRAYDKQTGAVVWETELPGGTTGAPMTYMVNGKQYIVVAVGWEGQPAELIALALP